MTSPEPLQSVRKSLACANCGFPNTQPQTPPELKEALTEFENALHAWPFDLARETAAHAALLALYVRQREHREYLYSEIAKKGSQVAALSSRLERLKAEQITRAEALAILADPGTTSPLYPAWCAAIEKIRLRSQSDTGDTNG